MTPNDWKILAKFGVTPDNLSVGGYLYLSRTPISALPDNLSVGGSLDLSGTPISALPDNLSVGGNLYLSDTPISALPDNLSVGRSLYLSDTPISALPDNLSVGGSLYLSDTDIKVIHTCERGYELRHSNGWFVAGCRKFRSREEALAHWGSDEYPDKKRGEAFCAAINAVEVAL